MCCHSLVGQTDGNNRPPAWSLQIVNTDAASPVPMYDRTECAFFFVKTKKLRASDFYFFIIFLKINFFKVSDFLG